MKNKRGEPTNLVIFNLDNRDTRQGLTINLSTCFPYYYNIATIVAGDFNIHHPLAEPFRRFANQDINKASPYFDLAAQQGHILINTLDVPTRFTNQPGTQNSTIDLCFYNNHSNAYNYLPSWLALNKRSGSDHTVICIKLLDAPRSILPPKAQLEPHRLEFMPQGT